MRRISLGFALAAVATSATLQAQWQAIGTPNNSNTGAYWNNVSDDNINTTVVCNAGAILTNTPNLAPTSCNNQAPVYLPITPAPLTTANMFLGGMSGANPGAFRFNCLGCTVSLLGRVAGDATTSWGVLLDNGTNYTSAQLAAGQTVSGNFAVYITQALPTAGLGTVYSSAQQTGVGAIGSRAGTPQQQFAVFSNTAGSLSSDMYGQIINIGLGEQYFVGMEDNVNGGRGFGMDEFGGNTRASDRDYNDIIVSIQAVPEPATIGLMGFGLLVLGGIAKRRKTA
jgi:PEP-CTERM motif